MFRASSGSARSCVGPKRFLLRFSFNPRQVEGQKVDPVAQGRKPLKARVQGLQMLPSRGFGTEQLIFT